MDNQKFNKTFKVGYVSLLVLSLLVTIWYWAAAAGKDCLACTLPVCEAMGPDGESYFMPADSCALSYSEIQQKQTTQGISIQECSQECINYADIYLIFSIGLVVIAIILMFMMVFYAPFVAHKTRSKTVVAVGIFIVIAAILGYILASPEIPEILGYQGVITKFEILMTDALLHGTYILLGGAVLVILSPVVIKYLRR